MLFGDGGDSFEDELEDLALEEMLLLQLRRKGPLGKLHNLIYWCVRSPQRNERLMALQ